jgi:hypothetical protein
MFSGTIAAWQRAVAGRPVDTKDAHKERERIYLEWQPRGVSRRAGVADYLREAARNPGGSDPPGKGSFFETAVEVKVPHRAEWPAVRFERPDGTSDDADGIVRVEAIAANNVVYLLLHVAPRDTTTPEVRAAFDQIAVGLAFAAPAPLGQALRVGDVPRPLPGIPDATIRLLEPFRGHGSLTAHDLAAFTHRHPTGERETEDFIAHQAFAEGGRQIPETWVSGSFKKLTDQPAGWLRDEPELRIAHPLPRQAHGRTAFVAGRKLTGGERWLWVLTFLPPRVVTDAGGDGAVTAVLEECLRTAEPATDARTD